MLLVLRLGPRGWLRREMRLTFSEIEQVLLSSNRFRTLHPRVAFLVAIFLVMVAASVCPVQTKGRPQAQTTKASSRDEDFADDKEPCPGNRKKTGEAKFWEYAVRTYRYPNSFGCFVISRGGRAIYRETSMDFQIGGSPSLKLEGKQDELTPIGTDVTGLGRPDLVIGEWTGGAHCCFLFHVFELGSERLRKVTTIDAEDSDGSRFADVDHDGRAEFLTNDWTFAYWHTGFMQSPAPDVILRFRNGKFRLALDLMRKPTPNDKDLAAEAKKVARNWDTSEQGPPHEYWGKLLDLIYTGNARGAWSFAEEAWPRDKEGRAEFIKEFKKQLRKNPYWEELKELDGQDLK